MTSSSNVHRTTELKEHELQSKLLSERTLKTETNLSHLCDNLISFCRRTAKIRNDSKSIHNKYSLYPADNIAQNILDYALQEKSNKSTSDALKCFSEHLSLVGDYQNAEVERLTAKVLQPLSQFNDKIHLIKGAIKNEITSRRSEGLYRKKLEKVKTVESRRTIELQLHNAIMDATKSADQLEQQVLDFEVNKLQGVKDILLNFTYIQMLWHSKALEKFSECFEVLNDINLDHDLSDFQQSLLGSSLNASPSRQSYSRSISLNMAPNLNKLRTNSVPLNLNQATEVVSVEEEDDDERSEDLEESNDDDSLNNEYYPSQAIPPTKINNSVSESPNGNKDEEDDDSDLETIELKEPQISILSRQSLQKTPITTNIR